MMDILMLLCGVALGAALVGWLSRRRLRQKRPRYQYRRCPLCSGAGPGWPDSTYRKF